MSRPKDAILEVLHRYRRGEAGIAEDAANEIVEICAVAAEAQDRTGREWVHDSLWAKCMARAGQNVRRLKFPPEHWTTELQRATGSD